jgi:hypothetical protein
VHFEPSVVNTDHFRPVSTTGADIESKRRAVQAAILQPLIHRWAVPGFN